MADLLSNLSRLVVRVLLVAMGLVFFASLLCVVLVLAALWGVRAAWAKLTGQPVSPWVMRVNPGAGWNRAYQAADRWRPGAARPAASRDLSDVTDVTVKTKP